MKKKLMLFINIKKLDLVDFYYNWLYHLSIYQKKNFNLFLFKILLQTATLIGQKRFQKLTNSCTKNTV